MIEKAIFDALKAEGNVRALFGTNPTRIFPDRVPQKEKWPNGCYYIQPQETEHDMEGEDGLTHATFIFEIFDRTFNGVVAAQNAIRDALSEHNGALGTYTYVVIMLDREAKIDVKPTSGEEISLFGRMLIYDVHYNRPAPAPT